MWRAHDCSGQERPLVGGSATDTGRSSASGLTNSFHVSMKRSREGMRWGRGRPVALVYLARRQVMNSDGCLKPPLGTFKSISNSINRGAGNRTEAYCFTACICLLRMTGTWATSVACYQRTLAKGDEATHSPRSWEIKGSRKLLAPLKRVSVMLSSRRVSRENGITRGTQGKKEVGSRVRGGTAEGFVGLHNQLSDYATPVATRWAPFDHPNTSNGHGTGTSKAWQMCQNWINVLTFGRLVFTSCHMLKIQLDHIGFNVGF